MAARPKLTSELADTLAELLGGGATRSQAAAMVGVDRGSLARWLQRGAADRRSGTSSLYADLAGDVTARALLAPADGPLSEGEALGLLEQAARRGSITAAAIVLRYRCAEREAAARRDRGGAADLAEFLARTEAAGRRNLTAALLRNPNGPQERQDGAT
jgi:hypothetical protein